MIETDRQARLSLAAIVFAGAVSAVAALPVRAADAPSSQQVALENKTQLVKQLLSQSLVMQRIAQSGNAQAKKLLADAQALQAMAAAEAGAGRQEAAIKLLDEALRDVAAASRLVPDPVQMAVQERARYASLSEATRTFVGLYQGLSKRMAARQVAMPAALDLERVNGMMATADTLAGGGDHKGANVVLGDAYKSVVAALNKTLMAETIVYDLKFDSPADEFKHELARNRSYEELVPLAISQLNIARDSAQLSERYVQQSKGMRDAAQKAAAGGDYQAALKTIQEATSQLQRALRVAGVIVPQSTEGKP
jgi:tetratricopeptide (TPR) repeat protein